MLTTPTTIYINWASYDELSDNVELTEALALQQLDELLRLRRAGVSLEYYLMDAFWFAPDGGYRTWRTPHWPDGPDRWLNRCLENGVKPGLWVTANTLCHMDLHPAWAASYDDEIHALCCYSGGFLAHYIETLHQWYERGVRLFKFDFADFTAAPAHLRRAMLPSEIRTSNTMAWQGAMKAFRQAHPAVVLLAYNGYEEFYSQGGTGAPLRKVIDQRWLDVFDVVYCGDPRPADVPTMRFWRSKDIYSDHMVRFYAFNNIPLERIDNSGFMVGTTGTCYHRRTAAWQGMLLLSLARGGWAHTYYGNLDLIDDEKAAWFARAQRLFLDLQSVARTQPFGGMPGEAEPYGFALLREGDGLLAVVNPSQAMASLQLPVAGPLRLLFHDAGFTPELTDGAITLGPEQMALIGAGSYADASYDLGVQQDCLIPRAIDRLDVAFTPDGDRAIVATIIPPAEGHLRIVMQQQDARGPVRTTGGSPPDGIPLGSLLQLRASQDGQEIPVAIEYDKAIWSGLSWAVGEVACADLHPGSPLTIRASSTESRPVTLTGALYAVRY